MLVATVRVRVEPCWGWMQSLGRYNRNEPDGNLTLVFAAVQRLAILPNPQAAGS